MANNVASRKCVANVETVNVLLVKEFDEFDQYDHVDVVINFLQRQKAFLQSCRIYSLCGPKLVGWLTV